MMAEQQAFYRQVKRLTMNRRMKIATIIKPKTFLTSTRSRPET